MRDRKCTDPIICCLFILWIVFMIGISGYAFSNGDVNRLAWKFDMDLVNCTDEYPKKLFTNIIPVVDPVDVATFDYKTGFSTNTKVHYSVCVKKCPMKDEKVEYMENKLYGSKANDDYTTLEQMAARKELEKWT